MGDVKDDELEKELTEITKMEITSVSGVADPANGAPFLLMKSAADDGAAASYAPLRTVTVEGDKVTVSVASVEVDGVQYVAKSDSQEADHIMEVVTGSKPDGALCNAPTGDGGRCGRQPAPGNARCHHHTNVALKGAQMDVLKQLGVSPELAAAMAEHAALCKGAVQRGLNGTATPELGGTVASGGSGVGGPMTAGVNPAIRANMTESGTPGVVGPLQGGESAYTIPAEAGLSGGGGVQTGQSEGLAAMVRALSSQGQKLPAGDPEAIRRQAVKQLGDALSEVLKAQGAVKTAEDHGSPEAYRQANEDLTLAKLRAHATTQFGAGTQGGER